MYNDFPDTLVCIGHIYLGAVGHRVEFHIKGRNITGWGPPSYKLVYNPINYIYISTISPSY